jgi:dihydropteroate synthase
MIWSGNGFRFKFPTKNPRPLVMGILNITPDSFSGDGLRNTSTILKRAREIEKEGADILDIGAESTRPGAHQLSAKEELRRLLPVLKKIRQKISIPISVDTTKPEVARASLEVGASIINDVSCLRDGVDVARAAKEAGAGYILMHARGTSKTMKTKARYKNVTREVVNELKVQIKKLKGLKFSRAAIAIDPGIGFAKNGSQNFELLRSIESLGDLGYPICLGISRKSFIGELTKGLPKERDIATSVLHGLMIERGVHIIRTHSVKALRQTILVTRALLKKGD